MVSQELRKLYQLVNRPPLFHAASRQRFQSDDISFAIVRSHSIALQFALYIQFQHRCTPHRSACSLSYEHRATVN